MSGEFSDIGSVRALLTDARERIKESEDRSKDTIDRLDDRVTTRMDELERAMSSINLDLTKWIPLLTTLQQSEERKKALTILLISSFITNIAALVVGVFIFFAKVGVIK